MNNLGNTEFLEGGWKDLLKCKIEGDTGYLYDIIQMISQTDLDSAIDIMEDPEDFLKMIGLSSEFIKLFKEKNV